MKDIALQKGLTYYKCTSWNEWAKIKSFFKPTPRPSLLELEFDMTQNANAFHLFKTIKL
jgi:hypothetical protein